MQIEQLRPTAFQLNLHAYELATLITTARWVAGGAQGELPPEAVNQLQKVIASYDAEWQRLTAASAR